MELSAVTAIASPVNNIDGMPYAFTISLNHQLRIWNLITGKIAYMGDLLNEELDPKETVKKVIDPSLSQLIKVFSDDERALCVTYSPLDNGEFKFWMVTPKEDSEDGSLQVVDIFPKNQLVPRCPTSAVWTLADFSVVLDQAKPNQYSLWTLWKNNLTYRVQKLDFRKGGAADGSRIKNLQKAWRDDWRGMTTEILDETPKPLIFSGDSMDITDKWVEFLLSPGRYTTATIETGLAIFENNNSGIAARRSGSLPERMCSVVASNNTLGRAANGSMDYESLRQTTGEQWNRFYRLICELDKQRGEAQSLVLDPIGNLPWVILADGITAVRKCSNLERIWHNQEIKKIPANLVKVAAPILVAAEFRNSLSSSLLHSCKSTLLSEMFEEPSLTGPSRMRAFYDKCDFPNQIADEDYNQVVDDLKIYGSTFKDITPEVYEAMVSLMIGEEASEKSSKQAVGEFGRKLIIRGTQETIELHRNIIIDQIILLVLIEAEVNHTESGNKFETATVFLKFLDMLKKLELLDWLVTTQISLPSETGNSAASAEDRSKKPEALRMETVPVMDAIMRHIFDLEPSEDVEMTIALTKFIQQICSPDSSYETVPSLIQCYLLHQNRPDLAMELSRFSDQDPFSTYIQGRACLASNDPQAAAVLFKRAAFGICKFS